MSVIRQGLYIVAAKRTPFGAFGGLLKNKSSTDLAEIAAKACLLGSTLSPSLIDTVIFGNVVQSNRDSAYLARHVAIRVGAPLETPALTVNRLCGSGFQSVISAVQEMQCGGTAQVALVGGSESMSAAPFVARNMRFGTQLGTMYQLEDMLWESLTDHQFNIPMGETAERLAEKYCITREECDRMALSSQARWKTAHSAGVFRAELCHIRTRNKSGTVVEMDYDEHPRDSTSLDQLAKLKPVFRKDGVVTAGNASGICDGAGALILATEKAVRDHGLKPLARLVAYAVVGCEPTLMGIGPVAAVDRIMKVLEPSKTGRDAAGYFDLIEVNEAFAAQYLAVERELRLDPARTNPHGGAIAMGHPVGASGARILAHLAHQLAQQRDSSSSGNPKRALGTACIGGGQGIAVSLEAV